MCLKKMKVKCSLLGLLFEQVWRNSLIFFNKPAKKQKKSCFFPAFIYFAILGKRKGGKSRNRKRKTKNDQVHKGELQFKEDGIPRVCSSGEEFFW